MITSGSRRRRISLLAALGKAPEALKHPGSHWRDAQPPSLTGAGEIGQPAQHDRVLARFGLTSAFLLVSAATRERTSRDGRMLSGRADTATALVRLLLDHIELASERVSSNDRLNRKSSRILLMSCHHGGTVDQIGQHDVLLGRSLRDISLLLRLLCSIRERPCLRSLTPWVSERATRCGNAHPGDPSAAAAHEHDRAPAGVAFARNVGGDFDARGQAHTSDLTPSQSSASSG